MQSIATRIARRHLLAWLAVATVLLVGPSCTDHSPTDEGGRSVPAQRFAVITAVESGNTVPGAQQDRVRISAFFARHAGASRDDVLNVLNIPDVPDPALLGLQSGACQVVERSLEDPLAGSEDGFVDLLDAGELQLRLDEVQSRLHRRAIPEIFPSVSGVTYEYDLPERANLDGLLVEARGSRHVGDFIVRLEAPSVPKLLEVAGEPVMGDYASIDWHADLLVRWAAPQPDDPPNTRTYIEVAVLTFDRSISLRCRTVDSGAAVIPRTNLDRLAEIASDDATVTLVVRRVYQQPFATAGLHTGDAFYVARDSVVIRR